MAGGGVAAGENGKRQPGIPAGRTGRVAKFSVALEVDVTLKALAEWKHINAFWSVTMYDGKSQLLVENPINRYLINSPMLSGMKKNADGSRTLYIQNKSPGIDKESNWLPAPNDLIYLVMRLYCPRPNRWLFKAAVPV